MMPSNNAVNLPSGALVQAEAGPTHRPIPMPALAPQRPRLWTLLLAVLLPGIVAAGWAIAQADGHTPHSAWQVGLGALLLLGTAVIGVLWGVRRTVGAASAARVVVAHSALPRPALTGSVPATALRHTVADLEREVAQAVIRTRLTEKRASRSQHVEALGRLTGGVAHDFNNLLGIISNSAHLMRCQTSDPTLQAPLAATLRAVAAGSRLTQHLLNFASRQARQPQGIDLTSALPRLRELMQTVVGPLVEVSVSVSARTPRVTVDTNELELALTNLALNARDAMPVGGHLVIGARLAHEDEVPDLPSTAYVLITVGDDGVGLDDDEAGRVFEPFFTTREVGQGTGLSLAQVLGFCVHAGGTARLTSTLGLGTTVSMLLPASNPPAAAPPPSTLAALPSIAGARLLLVEDNGELAEVTTTLLAGLGCRVERARGANEALQLIDARPAFDVVLSDVMMGNGPNGIDLARTLRERAPDLPVLLISGHSNAFDRSEGFLLLRKPCAPEQLVGALHNAIERAAPRSA